jgi:dihydropteroate synthase
MLSMRLRMGHTTYELADRVLVMGILNRTTDSFYDGGAYFSLEDLLRRAERLVSDGADVLDVGARAGGVGTRALSVAEERDLAVETVAALVQRFDVPVSIDTWHAEVAAAAYHAGAVLAMT